jgi:hypothetical protein
MASAKFSAFQFASEEFNSDLASLVNGFTQSLVKLITEECVRNKNKGEDSEIDSNQSSPFSSPTGKEPRKKSAPKRGRPSKDDTDIMIDVVDDVRDVSDELISRVEMVRSSSNSPRNTMVHIDNESTPVILDSLMQEPILEETDNSKKGKGKAPKEKVVKAPKEKVVKEPKEKVVKAPKEKVVKEPKEKKEKVAKEPKAKKEKVAKEPKAKKEKVAKEPKAKKDEKSTLQEEPTIQQNTQPIPQIDDEDDNDGLDAELVNSQTVDLDSFEKMTIMDGGDELTEEYNYANVYNAVTKIIDTLENVIAQPSRESSQQDDIVIDEDGGDEEHDEEEHDEEEQDEEEQDEEEQDEDEL